VNPLDPADETEALLEDTVSDPEPDSLLEEGTMVQTAENEPESESEPVKKKAKPKKERWVPIEFPPLPPRGEFDIREVGKSDYFFH
jgi:DNA-directed RNA polymerase